MEYRKVFLMKVLIIIPANNEEESILDVIDDLNKFYLSSDRTKEEYFDFIIFCCFSYGNDFYHT